MNATWALVLSGLSRILATIEGDPVHATLGKAVRATLDVAADAVDGAEIDPQPIADHLQAVADTGRTPTPDELTKLHAVATATANGEAPAAVPADTAPATPTGRPAIRPRT